MSAAHLIAAVKEVCGIKRDVDLASRVGVGRSFFCLVKKGHKKLPDNRLIDLADIGKMTVWEANRLYLKEDDYVDRSPTLPPVSLVLGQLPHEAGVLPDAVLRVDAEAAPQPAVPEPEAPAREGRSEPGNEADQSGAGPVARPHGGKKRKRGTRAAVVLVPGKVYYPAADVPAAHTFRRLIGIVRQDRKPGRPETMVVYSTGTDTNHVCSRKTFLSWLDPERA